MRKLISKRVDSKGRELPPRVRQRKDGTYEFRYDDAFGKKHSVYSKRLFPSDTVNKDKMKPCIIDIIKEIEKEYGELASGREHMTVYELCERYVRTKTGVKHTTKAGYKTVLNILMNDEFGKRRIDTIRISDARLFLIKLQKEDNRSYSSIHNVRGVLRPAFQSAVEDDYLRKNPFDLNFIPW